MTEPALRLYQEQLSTVAPPQVASADVQAAADLMARKILLEVRLGMLRSYLREDNEEVVQTRIELEQARIRETMDAPTVQILDPAVPPPAAQPPATAADRSGGRAAGLPQLDRLPGAALDDAAHHVT